MSRHDLDSSTRTEISGTTPRELVFIRIPFSTGTLAITTGDKDYSFTPTGEGSPVTFSHGAIGGLDNFNENMNRQAERASITLSGCDASLISAVAGHSIHWLRVQVWLGYVDSAHALVHSPPYLAYDGFLGSATLNSANNGSSLVITAESLNAALARISQVRACDADQKNRGYSTDTIFHQCGSNTKRVIAFGNNLQGGREDQSGNGGNPGEGATDVPGSKFVPFGITNNL